MNHSENKSFFFFIGFWIGILFFINGCHSSLDKDKQAEIDSIAIKWIPDHREGICNVTAVIGKRGSIILRGETTIPQAKQEIIKALSNPDIVLIDSILILPDTVRNEKYRGLVSLSVINLRKQPDHSSELVSQAILGTPVLILKDENSWLLIQTPDRYIAWTEKSSIEMISRAEINKWRQAERIIFLENSGWVYTSPEESGVVGDLVAGSILEKTGESKGYLKVILPDGREGFVRKNSIMDFNLWKGQVPCTEENVCRIASTFLGIPYLWGGSSSKAVDCSGFVQSVYFINGIILPRDASLQADHGLAVNLSKGYSQLKRGDLLFFGSKGNSTSHVTHVAIYTGDGEYINSSGRVMINSLDSTRNNYNSYRENSLLAAKRIIGVENDLGIVPVIKHPWY
ncbi:MAG: C40 family peptidase [Bacteroidia bacterium]|nr:C40 family peptidase [Bacteroidia bacterium]